MNGARRDGLMFLFLGCLVFLLLGVALESIVPGPMSDFKAVYYGARCVMHHQDPYADGQILREYVADGGTFPADPIIARSVRRAVLVCINLPTGLLVVAPFALLPWAPAHLLWLAVMAASLTTAAFLMWNLAAERAPLLAGALIALILVNSEVVMIIGNAAAVAIGLCVIAVWCLLKNRFAGIGMVCLALSLLLKPHDAGLVWLYFLLAAGAYRKRALQTLLVVVLVAIPAVVWVSQVSPHWMQELHTNLALASARGDLNDPGPTSLGAHTLGMIVSLQTVVSYFHDDPRFYNPVTYFVCAPLLLAWGWFTLRTPATTARTWLALASIATLSLLPVYHRQYDTKLLLLTVPACALLWSEGGRLKWLALLVNLAGILVTGDLPWAVVFAVFPHLHIATTGRSGQMVMAAQVFPVPLTLLAVGVFYLWVYARRPAHAGAVVTP
jgi:hypothetical protein